jgi:vacuolar protein sorting-associated protein 35
MFKTNIDNIIANKAEEIPINKLLELQVAFLKFSIYCYPNESTYVNQILGSSTKLCS